jgi:hypothetical protein
LFALNQAQPCLGDGLAYLRDLRVEYSRENELPSQLCKSTVQHFDNDARKDVRNHDVVYTLRKVVRALSNGDTIAHAIYHDVLLADPYRLLIGVYAEHVRGAEFGGKNG